VTLAGQLLAVCIKNRVCHWLAMWIVTVFFSFLCVRRALNMEQEQKEKEKDKESSLLPTVAPAATDADTGNILSINQKNLYSALYVIWTAVLNSVKIHSRKTVKARKKRMTANANAELFNIVTV